LSSSLIQLGGPAGVLGGGLWVLIWGLFLQTHGTGTVDQQGKILALTHYDFSKFMVISVVLFMVSLVSLHTQQQERSGRLGMAGFVLTLISLALMALGLALSLWPIPWGSYSVDWGEPLAMWGGLAYGLSTLVLIIGFVLFGVGVLRARVWPTWVFMLLIVAPLTIVPWLHMTVYGGIFGFVWLVLGYAIWRKANVSVHRPRIAENSSRTRSEEVRS
jgi:hypothetical protein